MNRNEKTIGAAADALARRWKLDLGDRIAETRRAYIYKVDSPNGTAALKIYKKMGMGGEGAAVHFLRNLPPDVGVRIYRSSAWLSAVLMEWLDGETLDDLVADGQADRAIALTGQVARAVRDTNFVFPFIYQRVAMKLRLDFRQYAAKTNGTTPHQELQRSVTLLDHLIKTTLQERVVHGDLIFGNVILTTDGPRLIDPKGLRADPAYELGKALIMPYHSLPLPEFVERIEQRGPVLAKAIDSTQLRVMQWAAMILAHKTIVGGLKNPERHGQTPYLTTLLDMSEQ